MIIQDASENPRIASLTKLMQSLANSRVPAETFRLIRQGFREAYGPLAAMILDTRGLSPGEYRIVNLALEHDFPPETFDPALRDQLPIRRGGILGDITADDRPKLVRDADWSGDPDLHAMLSDYTSLAVVSIRADVLPGSWFILLKRKPAVFTLQELEETVLRSVLIGSLLESQTLAQDLTRANARIDRDIRELAALQRALLPDPLPEIEGLEIAVSYEPSGQAGGDLYDLFPLNDGDGSTPDRWCIFIGDASGHGPAAAMVMAIIQSILHAHPPNVAGPASLLAHANHHLCQKNIGGFFTAFLAIHEPRTRRFIYSNAGHPAPLLKTATPREICQLNAALSYPLGIDSAETFTESAITLNPGDTLLLFTDGITESRAPDRALFEADRLESEFRTGDATPQDQIRHLRKAIISHQHGLAPVDDQTMMVMMCV